MDAERVYALLQEACRMLDDAADHAMAAHVAQAMAMVHARYAPDRDQPMPEAG